MRYLCGLLFLLQAIPVHAQMSGRVAGSVIDATGAVVPGASVQLFLTGGKKPLLTTVTSSEGLFNFIGVRPAYYDLTIESRGFLKTTLRGLSVDPARETSVPTIKLQVASVTQSVDVSAEVQGVDTASAEVAETISMEQIQNLPLLDRDVLGILQTQPGVASNGNSTTVINGLRTSYSNMTLDGINIQDNYIRDNALDYTPNKLRVSQTRQVTMINSNANAAASGGATETAFATPSGTDEFHGEVFWYNRNNHFAANDWFNNQSGIDRPFLNQNQFGGSIGGPIKKDKLFFYATYEAIRAHQQMPVTNTILTDSARNGIFTYRDNSNTLRQINLLSLRSITIDPTMQALLAQVPAGSKINSNLAGDGLNTGGYRFNQRDNELNDNVTAKIDYNLSVRHVISGSYSWNRDDSDRPDAENDFSAIPKVTNPTHSNLLAASWRWTPSAHLTNELRGGFNRTYGFFLSSQQFGPYYLTGMLYSDPVNEFQPQGHTSNTYNLSDDAAYQRGSHYIQFGFHQQHIGVESYDASGVIPTYSLAMGQGQKALARNEFPGGISTTDLGTANQLLATLGGYIDGFSETYNVTSRNSGYVANAPFLRHFVDNDYAFYVQDKWKIARTLTVTIGLRYQLPGIVDERDSLELSPVIQGSAVQTLLSNATLNFAGSSAGRPWTHREWKDFAPNIGLAWDVFGDGKTAFRGGYSLSYVNDQAILAPESVLEINPGLQGLSTATGLGYRVATGVPPILAPDYQVPTTVANNYASNPFNTVGLIDPNLKHPHVQQYSVGIQHDFKGTVVEARYVGNHVVGAYRTFDFNQVQIQQNGFLPDFLKAQNNGFLAQARSGVFNPAYNASIPGSQPLTVFPKLVSGGSLTNSTVRGYIQDGEVAELASLYQTNGLNGSVNFFQNPNALGTDMLTNYSSSSYNALQLEARHRTKSGLAFEVNYTFSKVLSDADGDVQSRIQHFLDINNPGIERSRANFDLTHMIKADGSYDLPFGKGQRFNYRPLERLIGGWTFGSIMVWQSGAPFSIISGRGTLNREARSYYNTADTNLTGAQLAGIVKFRMTGDGPMIIAQSAINPVDGTGVSGDGVAPFAGQVFFNPGAGQIGTLQKRMFSGPWTFNIDMRMQKAVAITETKKLVLMMDAFNALNHATFWSGDQYINNFDYSSGSTTQQFGVVSSMFYSPRVVQFGLHYTF